MFKALVQVATAMAHGQGVAVMADEGGMSSAGLLADIRDSLAELSATGATVLSKEDALRLISGQ